MLLLLLPPGLAQAPPALPPAGKPPVHPATARMRRVFTAVSTRDGIPVQRIHLYLDPAALQRAVKLPRLKALPPEEAAWQAFLGAELPTAWRYEALVDMGGSYRSRTIVERFRSLWTDPPMDPPAPEVVRYFATLDAPKNQGSWTEYVLRGPNLTFRVNGGPWVTFRNRALVKTSMRVDASFMGPELEDLKRALTACLAP